MKNRNGILKAIREKGNLDSEVEDMNLAELRHLHKILFEEAIRAGRAELGSDFDITAMKRKIDNTFEHMYRNMCWLPIDFCNRNSCDNYDMDCVSRKIKDQIKRITLEILGLTGGAAHISDLENEHVLETVAKGLEDKEVQGFPGMISA